MTHRIRMLLTSFIVVLVAGLASAAGPAHATFPGKNGKIVFASNATGVFSLYTMNPDGSSVTQITSPAVGTGGDIQPAWSPGGKRIAFRRGLPDRTRQIFVVNPDGSGLQQLTGVGGTTNSGSTNSMPDWTPDGSIVFTSNRHDPTCINPFTLLCTFNLFIMNADGSNVRQLTFGSHDDFSPAVSPDGATIAFTSNRSGMEAVWSTSLSDWSKLRQLTPNDMQAGKPDWSPDGKRIVFENNACITCPNSDLFLMAPNGKHITQLTSNFGNNLNPEWSPDGTRIIFQHGSTVSSVEDVYVMNADGTGLTNLTNSPQVDEITPDWGSNEDRE